MKSILAEREFLPIGRARNIAGQKFGRLTAIGIVEKPFGRSAKWLCLCDCGNSTTIQLSTLGRGYESSCGCAVESKVKNRRLYRIWAGMKRRCNNPAELNYERYGARGISVCEEWNSSDGFLPFQEWALSNGYEDGLTIDRIENSLGYSPANCQWATPKQQSNNRRSNLVIEAWGEVKTRAQWLEDERCNVTIDTITKRLRRGVPAEEAISTPSTNPARCITAWGETKSTTAWLRDDRCAVKSIKTIRKRLDLGASPEEAVSNLPARG
jgi:hypothetical protein